jgi:hypothetical protein
MKISITGPNKFEHLASATNITIEELKKKLEEIAKIVAKSGHELVLTPDKNSLLAYFGRKYLENKGKKIYEVAPLDEKDCEDYLDISLGEIISCGKWPLQPSKFNLESDAMVCVGYGGMVMAEFGFSKYYNSKTIYIIQDLISAKLPKEIEKSLDLKYIKIEDLSRILKTLK